MQIAKDSVVRFHYTVAEPNQASTESSFGEEPLAILMGHGNTLEGIEQELLGKSAGDHFEVTLPPERAFGEYREGAIQRVAKKHFAAPSKLKPGMRTVLQTEHGPRLVTVHKVGMSVVDIDLNHPLAGKTVHFTVKVVDVRAGTAEEIAHGHVHGDGGHAH